MRATPWQRRLLYLAAFVLMVAAVLLLLGGQYLVAALDGVGAISLALVANTANSERGHE